MALKKYCYYSGEEIRVGDIVLYPGVGRGKVEKIIIPHSREALLWNQPRGGVFFTLNEEIHIFSLMKLMMKRILNSFVVGRIILRKKI